MSFIVSSSLPFSIVASDDFKAFVKSLNSQYQLPHHNSVSKSLLMKKVLFLLTLNASSYFFSYTQYVHMKDLVKTELGRSATHCSLTADCWTSNANESFLGVTCHYIDFRFRNLVI